MKLYSKENMVKVRWGGDLNAVLLVNIYWQKVQGMDLNQILLVKMITI